MAKKKYICTGCNKCTEPCTVELSGDADMTKDPAKLMHCGTWVEVPAEENTNKEQLPKLTTAVFSFRDCPNWAHYAAVDAEGVAYWYAAKPKLDPQAWCNVSENFHAKQITLANMPIRYDKANWRNSLIERPAEEQPAKLTQDVFSMSECPEWAQYAAVDADGVAYYYRYKPICRSIGYKTLNSTQRICDALFDVSDWRNSLIERPAVVPDWFKPGVLAYNNDTHSFFHVTDSTEYCEKYLEAKVRPYSDDELERKLGQCVLGPKNSRLLVTGFRPKGDISGKSEICVLCGWLTAEELLTYGSRPQGIKQYHSKEGTWIDCGLSS